MQPRASMIPLDVFSHRRLSSLGKIIYGWLYDEPDKPLYQSDINEMTKAIGSPEPRAIRKCLKSLATANLILQNKEKHGSKTVVTYKINKEYFNARNRPSH